MSERIALLLVALAGLYLAAGLVFAVAFAWRGSRRLDPAARDGSWGFRLLILPGSMTLWPLLARRWLRGAGPPEERNDHRRRTRDTQP